MAAISGVNTGSTSILPNQSSKEASLGKEDFLKLLVAQLENQDPMNPSDPTEFTAQLAQFSQLEQLTNITTSLEGLNRMSSEMEQLSALSLMGQEVVAQTEDFQFSGGSVELGYRLEEPAEEVTLYVLGATGSTMASLSAEETAPGQYFVDWDGMTDYGLPAEPGEYSLVVRAVDGNDKTLPAKSLLRGRVQAVDLAGSQLQVETSAGSFAMNKVERVGG